ncbi:hypothetical protein Tco_0472816 [Tanacetum coccineum]
MMRKLLEKFKRMGLQKRKERDEGVVCQLQASIKRLLQETLFQWIQRKTGNVEERITKTLKEEKATITEAQHQEAEVEIKTIDELENFLRVVDFEKNAQDKSPRRISRLQNSNIDSPDGEYLFIHKQIFTSGLLILYGDTACLDNKI